MIFSVIIAFQNLGENQTWGVIVRILITECIECGGMAKIYAMETDGKGSAAAAFTCTNHYCRASFAFRWKYGNTGRKHGFRPIEQVNGKALAISGKGIGRAYLSCPECGGAAHINKKVIVHKEMLMLYHKCKSCGVQFSSYMEYSHMISVSALKAGEVMRHVLNVMTPEQLNRLAKASGNAAMLPKN
jgi:RecJ-like exonuclease